jgi:tetratricopeptide (TPR) repeat protein
VSGQVEKILESHSANIFLEGFAKELYSQKDYERAYNEFDRFVFLNKGKLNLDSTFMYLAKCSIGLKRYDNANKILKNLLDSPYDKHNAELRNSAVYFYSYSLFLQEKNEMSLKILNTESPQDTSFIKSSLIALNYLQLRNYKLSKEAILNKNPNNSEILFLIDNGEKISYKSPFLAGLFSAIIPGTGKIYTERTFDGLFSLISIGILTWRAYLGFHEDQYNSTSFWFYGSLSALLYAGNVYGSVKSAELYNEQLNVNYNFKIRCQLDKIFKIFDCDPN